MEAGIVAVGSVDTGAAEAVDIAAEAVGIVVDFHWDPHCSSPLIHLESPCLAFNRDREVNALSTKKMGRCGMMLEGENTELEDVFNCCCAPCWWSAGMSLRTDSRDGSN